MPNGSPGSGNTYTWIGSDGIAAAATVTADWSPNGTPGPNDTAILTDGGTILLSDPVFQNNVFSLGLGELAFTGDSLVNSGTPSLDATSLITTNVGGAGVQASTIEANGNFINAGTILADGAAGSTLTLDVDTAVLNGITAADTPTTPEYTGRHRQHAADQHRRDGGVVQNRIDRRRRRRTSSSTAPVRPSSAASRRSRGMMLIEGGGTIETNSGYASTVSGTRAHAIFSRIPRRATR